MNKPKPFTKGELNLMLEFALANKDGNGVITPIIDPYDPNKTFSATNPFSGAVVMLNDFCFRVYNRTMSLYRECQRGGVPVSKYDRMKYLLLKVNPDAYMDLID